MHRDAEVHDSQHLVFVVQSKRVTAEFLACRHHVRSHWHIAVEDVETWDILLAASPLEELRPNVGIFCAVSFDSEDALFLAR